MLPQQYNPVDYYATHSQYVNGYSGPSSQSVDPGPSTSTAHSSYPPQIVTEPSDSDQASKARMAARSKRKRGDSVADDSADNSPAPGSASANGTQKSVPKKKKANRACFHCQKAHLTCDDSRPCQRCIKRGIGDKCTEGIRKKAKYLLDEEELAALKAQQHQHKAREKSASVNDTPAPGPSIPSSRPPDHAANPPPIADAADPLFNLTFDPTYTFGSEAANLEYSILSAILGNPSPPDDNARLSRDSPAQPSTSNVNGAYPHQFANPEWPAPPPPAPAPPETAPSSVAPGYVHQQSPVQASPTYPPSATAYRPPLPHAQSYGSVSTYHTSPSSAVSPQVQQGPSGAPPLHQPQAQMHYSQPPWTETASTQPPMDALTAPATHDTSYARATVSSQPPTLPYQQPQEGSAPPGQGMPPISPPPSNSSPGTPMAGDGSFGFQSQAPQSPQDQRRPMVGRSSQLYQAPNWGFNGGPSANAMGLRPVVHDPNGHNAQKERPASSVYDAVTKPYDYTQGYHDLMRHLHERFDNKNDILRVVRALAIVRPSLIALQMPLTEEDEIFVEKCFQRSLIEMDKLISFGGTPTVVWRRTGEICLVGFEFTMLTGWTREELIGKGKYIYELFENQSTVEYYEKFAAHAFENTTQSVISHCILLKPSGQPVPCAFCFSIKRDIFDLPNMIIGQWLPLL